MKPKVSIIMGIYNCSATIEEAVDSILKQTYENWKLIMCDDGSTDDTYNIALSYSKRYPDKMVLIQNSLNQGLNITLNHCLEYADTEYIARMDGDDISLPRRIEAEVEFLDSHPEYAIVSSPMVYFDEAGVWKTGKEHGEPTEKDIAKGTPFCHAPCMVRKEAYDAVDGYSEDEKLLRVEDYDLWIKMLSKGYKGYNLSEPLYMVRDDRNAISRRKFKYRINEARVQKKAIKELCLPFKYYLYVLKPLLVGMLPIKTYEYLRKKKR